MASMQSFAMGTSFQLPVEQASEVGDIYDLDAGTDRQCPMPEKTKDQLVCMLIMSGFVILFWGIKGYREKRKTEE